MNIDALLEELYSYSMFSIRLGLDNIKEICKHLGNPQNSYKVIHITGTNGKGSTSTTVETILLEAGFKVGKYTSPHILHFNERIAFNNEYISNSDIAKYYEKVKTIINKYNIPATFFEVTTAMMFEYFKDVKADYVILEAGMGGRYDATNICDNIVSVITNVSLEHTEYLGDTIYKIAREKAGIIKNCPYTIYADSNPDVKKAIDAETNSSVNVLEKYKDAYYNLDFSNFLTNITIGDNKYEYSLFGDYQFTNFLCAYEVAKYLKISEEIIKKAVSKVIWQCRFEVFSKEPLVIFDGAHNAAGVDELCKIVKQHFKKDDVSILVSILKDKDRTTMFKKLNDISSNIILTSIPDNPRASTAKELYEFVENKRDFTFEEDPIKAYSMAISSKRKLTICCGSFYILIKLKEGLNE
ncbi:bifunctional folylpolyglutamate synthase/dihydrofolate synthase [Fusobacterium massiliense]|uniref:bifunctional folylpolyglutamate synthase/dihydrofolate synthase n=1 Tax=Fusobacterium massiliense TaxID=1852365 RepID=UPI0009404E0B|nr:folylpolyglutamate synthase/dihydrofolate synthase family protein [Fusobacterium massiliense]